MIQIRRKIEEKSLDVADNLTMQSQARYLNWLCNEEQIDMNEAIAIVTGNTEPREPEYMLGYKLANPTLCIALWAQFPRSRREQAAENFRKQLCPEELELFNSQVFQEENEKKFRKALKSKK